MPRELKRALNIISLCVRWFYRYGVDYKHSIRDGCYCQALRGVASSCGINCSPGLERMTTTDLLLRLLTEKETAVATHCCAAVAGRFDPFSQVVTLDLVDSYVAN